MGNVQVKYKAMRGSHEDGDIIEEPRDWFEALLVSQRDDTMVMYEALSDDKKEALNNCFDDGNADVFRNVGSANGWLGEADDDELGDIQTAVKALMASWA